MTAAAAERILAREGLRPLDYDDGAGGIKVGNRGSGKLLDIDRARGRRERQELLERRKAILANHRFRKGERRIYALYAQGMWAEKIQAKLGIGYMSVHRTVTRIEREYMAAPEKSLGQLLAASEPTTVILFFALLQKAIEEPEVIKGLIDKARAVPEVRQLLEPDEVCDG